MRPKSQAQRPIGLPTSSASTAQRAGLLGKTRGTAGTIAIFDIDAGKTRAEVLDLNHGAAFVPRCDVIPAK